MPSRSKTLSTDQWSLVALAGPANRQGRIAADVICGRNSSYRGTQGTAIIGLFGGAAAWTGVSEKTLKRLGETDYEKIYLYPNSHAGYYPGAQVPGAEDHFPKIGWANFWARRRLDKMAWTSASTPSRWRCSSTGAFTTSKRPSCATRRSSAAPSRPSILPAWSQAMSCADDMPLCHWDSLDGAFLLDVRTRPELAVEHVPGAINIPLQQLRARLAELPRDREIHVICRSGQRAYYATRILQQNGFAARNISGGMLARLNAGR